jgi:uncharacterized protein
MGTEYITSNLLNPVILFFFLGMLAVIAKSNLEIPQPLPKLFTLYLIFTIGFKGGTELHTSGIDSQMITTMLAAVGMAIAVPLYTFFILKRKLSVHNAAAIAATYGSVSAVTFITATSFLQSQGIENSGYMVAAMALMESPPIIIGVLLVSLLAKKKKTKLSYGKILNESFLNGSVFLLLGSLLVGFLSGEGGRIALKPFTDDIFKGMLAFFMLDMGMIAAGKIKDFKSSGVFLTIFAISIPVVNASFAIGLARLIGLDIGNALLFTVLAASASYIAVPAAMRLALPEASPSIYVPMSLAITFPFNIIIGIPLYMAVINTFWR